MAGEAPLPGFLALDPSKRFAAGHCSQAHVPMYQGSSLRRCSDFGKPSKASLPDCGSRAIPDGGLAQSGLLSSLSGVASHGAETMQCRRKLHSAHLAWCSTS